MRNNRHPEIQLAPQVLINCHAGGNCDGGSPIGAYNFAQIQGIPQESCFNYRAENPENYECSGMQRCYFCPKQNSSCLEIANYTSIQVGRIGLLSGETQMKIEIRERGPISCGIQLTAQFKDYEIFGNPQIDQLSIITGINSKNLQKEDLNHEVEIIGWGVNPISNIKYWIGKNSWGTTWGFNGIFLLARGEEVDSGVTLDCSWAQPIITF